MKHFLDYIEQAGKATNTDELFDALVKGVGNYGYDAVAFHLINDHSDVNLRVDGSINNVRKDMVEAYSEAHFNGHNPIMRYAKDHVGIFEWTDVPRVSEITKLEQDCLHFMEDFGFYNGTFITLHGLKGRQAGIGLSTSGKKDGYHYDPAVISAYCNHFYMRCIDLASGSDKPPEPHKLTVKELEIVTWIATGKSDTEISDIIGVSRHAINMRMRRIFKKMGTTNRIQTTVKAISMGIIRP